MASPGLLAATAALALWIGLAPAGWAQGGDDVQASVTELLAALDTQLVAVGGIEESMTARLEALARQLATETDPDKRLQLSDQAYALAAQLDELARLRTELTDQRARLAELSTSLGRSE